MTDEFDQMLSESLDARARRADVHGARFGEVRTRVRHRRQRRAAAAMVPALAALAVVGARSSGSRDVSTIGTAVDATVVDTAVAPSSDSSTAAPTSSAMIAPTGPAVNLLVVGTDGGACVSADSPWAGAADPTRSAVQRTDTMMIVRLDPGAVAVTVMSLPRDLWVAIAGKGSGRLNSTYVPGDPALLAQTIYDNLGVVVDHYVQVDFCAFKRLVDAVGGVAVPFGAPVVDRQVGLDLPAGCHLFSGDEALAYVRSRHLSVVGSDGAVRQDPTSDLGRMSRQRDFMIRLLSKALDRGLFDPEIATALLASLQTDLVTDQGLTIEELTRLSGVVRAVGADGVATRELQVSGTIVGGQSVLTVDRGDPDVDAALSVFRGGDSGVAPVMVGDGSSSAAVLPDATVGCD
jgi:LCP family protein required for cell wall assembly